MIVLPDRDDALRIAAFLDEHDGWSAFWDRRYGVWRVSEDDPDSELYAEDADAGRVIGYMSATAGGVDDEDCADERAPADHWITSFARSRSGCGMVRPIAFAVLRLMTSSNLVGCSAGCAPFKILSTKYAARRN